MNGLIYLMDGFLTDDIVVYDPVLRTIVSVLNVDGINGGFGLDLSGDSLPTPRETPFTSVPRSPIQSTKLARNPD